MQLQNQHSSQVLHHIGTALAVSLLIFSWFACFVWITALTEGWGAPWDTAPIRPPLGHWQRTINDFFESGIGVYLPVALFMTTSFLSYGRTVIRTKSVSKTSFAFGGSNLVALAILIVITIPVQLFLMRTPAHLTPEEWSYWGDFRREWPLILMGIILFASLLWKQPYLVSRLDQATTK